MTWLISMVDVQWRMVAFTTIPGGWWWLSTCNGPGCLVGDGGLVGAGW
jgi:hypothetical protein